jgi:hypothetical protein
MKGLLLEGHAKFKGSDWVLQQDNEPTHKTASMDVVDDWDKQLRGSGKRRGIMEGWSPNSPDLNIIEDCWSIIKNRAKKRRCDNFAEFEGFMQEIFLKIDPEPLYENIPKRLQECIQLGDERTHL